PRVPRAVRLVVVAEHPDQVGAQRKGNFRGAGLIRPRLRARLGQLEIREVSVVAGPEARLGDVQRQARAVMPLLRLLSGHSENLPSAAKLCSTLREFYYRSPARSTTPRPEPSACPAAHSRSPGNHRYDNRRSSPASEAIEAS